MAAAGVGGFEVVVWGARGTLPGCGPNQVAFGTETCCVEMRVGGRRLIFDAGTGIVTLGREMAAEEVRDIDIFFSHAHYDHIMGLPFFVPFYKPGTRVSVSLGHMLDGRLAGELVADLMRAPFLPIGPKIFQAEIEYMTFKPGDVLEPGPGIAVKTARLNHPNGAVGFRVEYGGRAAAYVTDTEHVPGQTDKAVLSLFRNADVVFYDTSYTEAEMAKFKGFGHSSWEEGVRLAKAANTKRLVLFHHSHMRDDDALAAIEREAKAAFAGAVVGRTGMRFALEPVPEPARPRREAERVR
ncbi:MBL fold metallo-hydrolase [Aureimonas leprariae]|uniref:MBL fold metallo-hydrolase n=2 Tax=Plantimonas leprariae TaxID=2615207 RepID=A0A7V7TVI6_9HYPH|nr:MBL fold metallo-hydrolase [Aureimonas leprariae]